MMNSLYKLALDFSKELNYTKAIMARQGDKGIIVSVKPFLNGLQMDTSGATFTLKGTTPSNRYVDSVAISVTDEEVIFSLDGTFMSEEGYYKHCYVEYRKDDQVLTTQDIIFFSLGVSDISQGQAGEYISQLERLIQEYNETFDTFINQIEVRAEGLETQLTNLKTDSTLLQEKLDDLKESIKKLSNLSVMYSNSIDFGDYDYSGNPNIAPLINDNNVMSLLNTVTKVTPKGTYATAEKIADGDLSVGVGMIPWSRYDFTPLTVGKQYTLTIPIRINEDYTGDISKLYIRLRCSNEDGGVLVSTKLIPTNTSKAEFVNISTTFTVPSTAKKSNNWYCQVGSYGDSVDTRGTVDIGYEVKLEEGSTATPYQPNLLDAPYYLSKTLLGENIADPAVQFPIKTSAYNVYQKDMKEPFTAGQTYTLTIKATKASTQTFMVYNEGIGDFYYGNLKTIEGLSDMWLLTFTPQKVSATFPKRLTIIQYPQSTLGACQIDWLKIEKGDTRTPNIQQYKYFGTGIKDSDDPNDFVWDLTPEYIEANFAKETDVKTNTNNIKMLIDDLRVVTANVAWMKNNTYVLGKWQDLPLAGGYQGGDGTIPKYRIDTIDGHKKLSFSGAVTTTNNTLPSQSQQHAISTLPKALIPSVTKMGIGPTSSLSTSCRIAVTSAGNLYVGNDSGKDVKYCYLDTFSYWLD